MRSETCRGAISTTAARTLGEPSATSNKRACSAYLRAEERLREQGGRVDGVVLDYELKRDYQRVLHERNRGRKQNRRRSRRSWRSGTTSRHSHVTVCFCADPRLPVNC